MENPVHVYPSDLTDEEWSLLDALIPKARKVGRPEKHAKAGDSQWDFLSGAKRLRVADAPRRSAAVEVGLALLFSLEKTGGVGAAQRHVARCREAPSG